MRSLRCFSKPWCNSVGGNMTAVIAPKAKTEGGPALKCQVMFWPVTDVNCETESYNQYDEGYFLTKAMMKWFRDAYTTDPQQRKEIYASPLQATTEQLKDLPPAMVQTAGNDDKSTGCCGAHRLADALRLIGTRSRAIRRRTSKEGANSKIGEDDGKELSSDSARARSQKQKEASRRAAPDARERIPTGAGGAARSYHFYGCRGLA